MITPNIAQLRTLKPAVACIGSHPGIIQSMLDFDFLAGHEQPSVVAIIASGRSIERFFFGEREVVIPVYDNALDIPQSSRERINLVLNVASGRRVLANTQAALEAFPNLVGGSIFAEGVPERHALELSRLAEKHDVWLAGPASVGVIIPGVCKLSAIGGIEARHLQLSKLLKPGSVAVVSSSGGMVNEIIRSVATSGHRVSFAVALGGERFPLLTPEAVLLAAEADAATTAIAYFGELGGQDEYAVAELVQSGRVTKPVVAYIAGSVSDLFAVPPQFGHAKAMASTQAESASAKTEALLAAGVHAAKTYGEFITAIATLPAEEQTTNTEEIRSMTRPTPGLFVNAISKDKDNDVQILGQELLQFADDNSFAKIVISMILGRRTHSKELEEFVDFCLRLLVDHGPYVSGAVNTMITARAGRDLVSALSSGLLTIGPRFGGAINQAAATWFDGVERNVVPSDLVEELAARKEYIAGIGHRKYRADRPDPRVQRLLAFADALPEHSYTNFARAIEAETTAKKANLILNVDGTIAAVLLDLLRESEGLSTTELSQLIDIEAFNALFVLSRSVGFMAHYFDQRRHDEGLFRLEPEDVTPIDTVQE
jgi:ATP citrate (pro-S)-lyase